MTLRVTGHAIERCLERVDWNRPLAGVPTAKGLKRGVTAISVVLNAGPGRYRRAPGATPVLFPRNLWTNTAGGGTWYFDDHGESIGGRNQDGGQDALWSIRNAEVRP